MTTERRRPPWLDAAIFEYIAHRAAQPDDVLTDLATETAEVTGRAAGMQIGDDQGALLSLLTALTGAQLAVEIGTFTGYSSICIARGLAPDGRLLCFDISEEYTAIARRAWARAGLDDRIELTIGPAADSLGGLPDQPVDFAFIDADKTGYRDYVETLLPRMRANGLICVDNTLWGGSVATPPAGELDPDTKALIEFNDTVAADERVDSFILPIGDGVTLIRKR
jgi:caffeoyl-CoA O-methyltransferase